MRKSKTDIDEALARYFANQADEQTLTRLNDWLSESEENRKQFEVLEAIWAERSPEPRSINTTSQEVLDRIWKKGTEETRKGKRFYFFSHLPQIAAAILIVLIAPLAVYWITSKKPAEQLPAQIHYIVKENPATQRSRFLLPDGSMVWLNCKSSLRYAENFSGSFRQVELIGEAFFEVKKDSLRPFIVSSGEISTTALGTSFNVAAYADKQNIDVALITGKVKIEDTNHHNELAVLNPGLAISYNKENNKVTKKKVNTENVLAWKSGILIFEGDDYQEFVWKIKQWYDVEVTTIGNVPSNWRIRGRFDNAYLTSILEVVSFNKDFSYQLKEKKTNTALQ